jgi:hypothetical protein
VCDLEIGILSENEEMMLIYYNEMYEMEKIEKYVLLKEKYVILKKMKWKIIKEVENVNERLRKKEEWKK